MAEAEAARLIEETLKAVAKEHPMDPPWLPHAATYPAQHLRRAQPPICALPMRPVRLVVVLGHPAGMHVFGPLPARHLSEVVISEPALQVELRFDQVLPCLLFVDLPLLDLQGLVDRLGLFRAEDTAAV